jgi:RND superfamily putative drug exporter
VFERLGRHVLRLRFAIVAGWVAAAAAFGILGPSLANVGSADETSFLPANAESLAARQLIKEAFPQDSAVAVALIVFSRDDGLTDADRAAIENLGKWFDGPNRPAAVQGYVTIGREPSLESMFRSADGAVELARLDLDEPSFLPLANEAIDAVRAHLAEPGVLPEGLTARVSGQAGIGRDYLAAIREGTDRTTLATIVLVVVILLLIYRAPLAALVPLATIGCAFLTSRGLLGFAAQAGWQLSSILDSFIVVLVFGVGTDYSIFLVSRFREELGRHSHAEAVQVTVGRIGAVIAASAATVVVGLTSMIVASFGMIQTTGPALAIVIVITLLAGLTLTPSLLAIFGRRLFWPLDERTRAAAPDDRGFWAGLARRITARPGVVAAVATVALLLPLLAIPGLKENFNLIAELPATAESRQGFDELSGHLGEGRLMPLNVLLEAPGTDFSSPASLTRLSELQDRIAATPGVESVSGLANPNGEGGIADVARPAAQLAAAAKSLREAPVSDLNAQLSDESLAGIQSLASYAGGLGAAYPKVSGAALEAVTSDLALIGDGLVAARAEADVAVQLGAIADQLAAASGTVSGASATEVEAQLTQLNAYLDELGAAVPELAETEAYKAAQAAIPAVAATRDATAYLTLIQAFRQMQAWFEDRPTAFYFMPSGMTLSAEQQASARAMAAARQRLPDELDALAALFDPTDLYAPPELLAAYVSGTKDLTRLYVTTSTSPYDTRTFDTVRELRALLAGQASSFGPDARIIVGGSSAEFADVQTTISADFIRVAVITILGILLVLILLLRAVAAPLYLVLTVVISYSASLSLSAFLLEQGLGQQGINYLIPLMVFVLLVALGSDYNIFLMSRVREESHDRPLRQGIRAASARTGTVITSAGLILAGTFAALLTSPLQILFQVGVVVALGVLIDTFLVRSILVPALTAFIGERAWWPFHRT